MSVLRAGGVCSECGAVQPCISGNLQGQVFEGGKLWTSYSTTFRCWRCGITIREALVPVSEGISVAEVADPLVKNLFATTHNPAWSTSRFLVPGAEVKHA
jgi:hypothetical protein